MSFRSGPIRAYNGVARTLKKYARQRETIESSNVPFQLHPFSKWELLLKERKKKRAVSYGMENHFYRIW